MFKTLYADRATIENKFHKTDEEYNALNRWGYHGYDYDPATGIGDEEMHEGLAVLVESIKDQPRPIIKARAVEYVLEHTMIDINEKDYFIALHSLGRVIDNHTINIWHRETFEKAAQESASNKLEEFNNTGTAWNWLDFDHTVPDWEAMTALGFSGLLQRAHECHDSLKASGTLTEKQEIFYQAIVIEYEALIRFVDRLYQYSLTKDFEKAPVIAACLKNLRDGAPQNTYEVLQMIWIYFMVSEHVEHYQVRSLGYGLDNTLYPYFLRDIENGTFTKEELTEFIGYFLMQFASIDNYWGQPVYLAGTNVDGSTKVNELSYLILDIYNELGLYNPKIQIKVNRNTPKDFVQKALDMIRSGISSIVFMNEDIIVKALMHKGATYEEAVDSVISGCYEYKIKNDGIGISSVYFNTLKMVELVFHNGADHATGIQVGVRTGEIEDFTSFKDFYKAFLTQFDYMVETSFACLGYAEKYVHEVNPSPLFSATMEKCITKMTDALDCGLTNVTGTLLNGFASAIDALMAVDELVYEKKLVTLAQLKEALDNNWEGYEKLRLQALNGKHKYGVGDRKADNYANALHQHYAGLLSGRKNCHGGNYGYELHSARSFIEQGKKTAATPDGRRCGDETSKNASPSIGADRNGITALISSVTNMDLSLTDIGACLDAMMHPSAVQGEEGLEILYNVLQTYLAKGGASIHFNIFNADTLRDAQKNPEKYKTLQVRVCGWNILWNNMAKEEQEAYIKRAENIV